MIDVFAVVTGVILTFLIVVVIHELGHFFAARMVGVIAEVFSVGFGKTLWSRKDRHGVIWQVCRIPAGGYVRFVGDENAASLSSVSDGPAIPGSLRAASKWSQAFVAVAGPFANVVFTVVALSILPMLAGVTSYPWQIDLVSLEAETIDLQSGDTLLSIDGVDIAAQDTLSAVLSRLPADTNVGYKVARDGSPRLIFAPRPDLPLIGTVAPGSPADQAGIRVGDLLISINGAPVNSWSDLQAAVTGSNGDELTIFYQRGDTTTAAQITPMQSDGRWLVGVGALPLFTLSTETPPIGDALVSGFDRTWELITNLMTGLAGSLMGQNVSCDLDGPIAIATVAGQAIQLGPETFLLFLAVISLGLGILNLLPIPILDGGHLLLLGFEGLTGRPLGKRMQAILFIGGVTVIVFLMLTATINDLTC